MSDYEILKSRIGKVAADRAAAFGFVAPPSVMVETQENLPLFRTEPKILVPTPKKKLTRAAQLGQFMTPSNIANFMAGMFGDIFS